MDLQGDKTHVQTWAATQPPLQLCLYSRLFSNITYAPDLPYLMDAAEETFAGGAFAVRSLAL